MFSQVWKRSGAWFFKGFPKHYLPSPMPLSNPKETGAQNAAAERQEPPPSKPREAVTQPAPGRHSQHLCLQLLSEVFFGHYDLVFFT